MSKMGILLQDIMSYSRKAHCYGRKGDLVEVISERGNVVIVQGARERFTVKVELLNIQKAQPPPKQNTPATPLTLFD